MPAPLTRAELDRMTCSDPTCTKTHADGEALYLHGSCHMESPSTVSYHNGVLTVQCAECGQVVTKIEVAPGRVS